MRILYVEPFESGSHAMFTRALTQGVPARWTTLTLPGRHWKWRMRGVAPWAALEHEQVLAGEYELVLASSYVPLAELVGLAPALGRVPRVLYFHENQLTYPSRGPGRGFARGSSREGELNRGGEPNRGGELAPRDHHFGFTQLVSALAATRCVFNSAYNRDGFLAAGRALLGRMPDAVPRGWIERIEARSEVLGVPVPLPDEVPRGEVAVDDPQRRLGPVIVWNHRWEHDKDPEAFFEALRELCERGVPFRVAVCGQRYRRAPPVLEQARQWLGARVVHWGYCPTRAEYWEVLSRAQVAVSTARHEFFGVAMLEATHAGAEPLVPDRLAYPEVFPSEYRYQSEQELVERLAQKCRAWVEGASLRGDRRGISEPYRAKNLLPRYEELFDRVIDGALGQDG
ncbi:MAG: DUF3524 domain-containing protein [Myxococcota bacterium]